MEAECGMFIWLYAGDVRGLGNGAVVVGKIDSYLSVVPFFAPLPFIQFCGVLAFLHLCSFN